MRETGMDSAPTAEDLEKLFKPLPVGRYKSDFCKRGHPMVPENLYEYPGRRECKTCSRINRVLKKNNGKLVDK